ncbi:uncharacterized protein LOC115767238 [Drosophila novamexicana]|uniref:uncharacterized protein LOC115767238 n=1 Tax=Drosophila novamexicana TaxID=47314 RepID=UPI0011E5BF75|nr:uncharacterized protein LOC115767238 [Drosophila novamexicana]
MTVTYLIPIYPPDNRFVLDWDDNVEASLLLALGFLVLMQLMLLIYIVLAHFQPCTLYRQQLNESYRRRYKNFIFRRLLAQLDRALRQRPGAGQELSSCLEAKRMAQLAIRLFCRDTTKVLYPEYELDSSAASDAYFVLDDEEAELNSAGYASVNFDVTDAFLESLLYPKRADIPSKNKTKL